MENGLLVLLLNLQTPQQPIQTKTDYSNILMVPNPLELDTTKQEKSKELTLEEKIKLNVNNCTDTQWIRADNAECINKSVYATKSNVNYTNISTNTYDAGFCTAFVKDSLPWVKNGWGNANMWAINAQREGHVISNIPAVGTVAQTSAGYYGHVAVVTEVNGEYIRISEMNFRNRFEITSRVVYQTAFTYIYP